MNAVILIVGAVFVSVPLVTIFGDVARQNERDDL